MKSRSQLIIAGGIVLVLLAGIFFYVLTKSTERFEEVNNAGFPDNPGVEVLNHQGNVEIRNQFGQDVTPGRESGSIRRVSTDTVAGYTILNNNDNTIRYIESQTGHIYDFDPNQGARERLTNTSFQRITRAIWVNDDTVLITYDQDGDSVNWLGQIDFDKNSLSGQIFPSGLESIAGDHIEPNIAYYLVADNIGGSTLYRYDIKLDQRTQILGFDFSQADLRVTGDNELFLITRPSPSNDQAVLQIFPRNRTYSLIPTDSKYGYIPGDNLNLSLTNNTITITDGRGDQEIVPGYSTQDKCSASNQTFICAVARNLTNQQANLWPDNWYRGQITPNEELISIDEYGNFDSIAELGQVYDADYVQTTNSHVYLISRTDGYLYEVLR